MRQGVLVTLAALMGLVTGCGVTHPISCWQQATITRITAVSNGNGFVTYYFQIPHSTLQFTGVDSDYPTLRLTNPGDSVDVCANDEGTITSFMNRQVP